MDVYAVWPFFACLAVLVGVAATPALAAADTPQGTHRGRVVALDGLRGFLAIAVMFHHGIYYRRFLIDGTWDWPSRFYGLLGTIGVAMFFMITGFLFWGRLIDEGGRPDWLRLYVGRVFRIGPLYIAALTVVLLLVLGRTGLDLQVSWWQFALDIGRVLTLGAANAPVFNGYDRTWEFTAGVTWTLRFEWAFYFLLPVLALATRGQGWHLPAALLGFALLLPVVALDLSRGLLLRPAWWEFFMVGMVCASLQRRGVAWRGPGWMASSLVLGLLALTFLFPSVEEVGPVLTLGGAFFLVTSGCDLFGLLTAQATRRLGDVSYGIYLLHGMVLATVLPMDTVRGFALDKPAQYWMVLLGCAVVAVGVATAAHVFIERPGIALGRVAAMRLARRRDNVPAH